MFINIGGKWFNPDLVAVVAPVDDDEDSCVIFTPGQSAVDAGFLIEVSPEDAIEALHTADLIVAQNALSSLKSRSERRGDQEPIPGDTPPYLEDDAVVDLGT